MHGRHFFAAAMVCATLCTSAWAADPMFTRPVRLVVPAPPGGFTDIAGRLLADHLTQRLGQSVVVENQGGASGIIGAEQVARSKPDGYTLLMGTSNGFAMNPALFKKLPYDPIKDFAPITRVATGYNVLVVHPSLAAPDLKTLIAMAKANPKQISYGSGGNGTSSHFASEILQQEAGFELLHVPFRGMAPALQSVIAGHVSLMYDTLPSALPHVQLGVLRALAVTSPNRLPSLPEVPAIAETIPGFEVSVWAGLYAPAGTPDPIIRVLDRETTAFLKIPAVWQRFAQMGFNTNPIGPEEFGKFLANDIAKWGHVIKKTGIMLD